MRGLTRRVGRSERLHAEVAPANDNADELDINSAWWHKRQALQLVFKVPRSAERQAHSKRSRRRPAGSARIRRMVGGIPDVGRPMGGHMVRGDEP